MKMILLEGNGGEFETLYDDIQRRIDYANPCIYWLFSTWNICDFAYLWVIQCAINNLNNCSKRGCNRNPLSKVSCKTSPQLCAEHASQSRELHITKAEVNFFL